MVGRQCIDGGVEDSIPEEAVARAGDKGTVILSFLSYRGNADTSARGNNGTKIHRKYVCKITDSMMLHRFRNKEGHPQSPTHWATAESISFLSRLVTLLILLAPFSLHLSELSREIAPIENVLR